MKLLNRVKAQQTINKATREFEARLDEKKAEAKPGWAPLAKVIEQRYRDAGGASAFQERYLSESRQGEVELNPAHLRPLDPRGLGRTLAHEALRDGHLDITERSALRELAQAPRPDAIPFLDNTSELIVRTLAQAPEALVPWLGRISNGKRGDEPVELSDLRQLGQAIAAGKLPEDAADAARALVVQKALMGIALSPTADAYLQHLGKANVGGACITSFETFQAAAEAANLTRDARQLPPVDSSPAAFAMWLAARRAADK